jgi:transcriptional regulator with XRE-family HTH domain
MIVLGFKYRRGRGWKAGMGGQDLKTTLGKNIKLFRFHSNLSQAELAEKVDISVNFLSELERGNKWPRAETLANIGAALDVSVSKLFQEAVPNNTKELMARFSSDLSRMIDRSIETVHRQYADFLPDNPEI